MRTVRVLKMMMMTMRGWTESDWAKASRKNEGYKKLKKHPKYNDGEPYPHAASWFVFRLKKVSLLIFIPNIQQATGMIFNTSQCQIHTER